MDKERAQKKRGRPETPKLSVVDPNTTVSEQDIVTALLYKKQGFLTKFRDRRDEFKVSLEAMQAEQQTEQMRKNEAFVKATLDYLERQEAKVIAILADVGTLLTEREQGILNAKYMEGLSDVKIAATFNTSCQVVRKSINQSIARLIAESTYQPAMAS